MKFDSRSKRRTEVLRRWQSIFLVLIIGLGLLLLINPAPLVRAQSDSPTPDLSSTPSVQTVAGLWQAPVNVSASGSASLPVIAAEPNGRVHVLWWDQFDGTKYVFRNDKGEWSEPVSVSGIYGKRTRTTSGKIELQAPKELKLVTNTSQIAFAFWRSDTGDLMTARTTTAANPKWSGGVRLLTTPLLWKVYVADDGSLNLVYIRAASVGAVSEPGIYFRRSKDGSAWTEPVLVSASLYFRTLDAADAHISLLADRTGQVWVGWDDPQTHQSYLAYSDNKGANFGEPELVKVAGIAELAVAKRIRFAITPDQTVLRFWEAGDSCVLYQQAFQADGTWSAPIRALEQVDGCWRSQNDFSSENGRLFMTIGSVDTAQTTLTAWDGLNWAAPFSPSAGFVDEVTNSWVPLGCTTVTASKVSVLMLGCDQNGDIWVLTSQASLDEFLPAAQSAWSQPNFLSKGQGDAGLPSVAVDPQDRFNVMWPQLPAPGNPGESIGYIRGNGGQWTDVSSIIQRTDGTIDAISALADPNQILHMTWSGGGPGQVYYNQSFERDSLLSEYWGDPKPLLATQQAGASPTIVLGPSGKLYVLYAVPFNDGRGLYFTTSSDLGSTWSNPLEVFDAAAAGWEVIHEASLVVDQQEHLHAVWSRAASPNQDSPLGIYYAQSLDGGLTWTQPLTISEETDSQPKLIVSSDNHLHLVWVHATFNGHQLLHQWSADGGQTWSRPAPVPGVGIVAPEVGLTADASGSVYLAGIELTKEGSAGIFYLRWNGETWTDRDSIRLGYDFTDSSAVRLALLRSGQLGVFYRVRVPTGNSALYQIGYLGRQLEGNAVLAPAATFTPRPSLTPRPPATVQPTLTPIVISGSDGQSDMASNPNTVLIEIGVIVSVMVVISVIAIIRLSGRISRS